MERKFERIFSLGASFKVLLLHCVTELMNVRELNFLKNNCNLPTFGSFAISLAWLSCFSTSFDLCIHFSISYVVHVIANECLYISFIPTIESGLFNEDSTTTILNSSVPSSLPLKSISFFSMNCVVTNLDIFVSHPKGY